MKPSLASAALLPLFLVACETGGPINSSSSFDPLDPAGGFGRSGAPVVNAGFAAGSFVKTAMDNAAFFSSRPKGDAKADKLLPANTPMKVISDDGNYLKVELDSGEVGFIPPIMVANQSENIDMAGGDEVQVWPPVSGPLPEEAGMVPTDPEAPVIPPTIDPDAPVDQPVLPSQLPDDAPTPGLGAEPPLPSSTPAETAEEDSAEEE